MSDIYKQAVKDKWITQRQADKLNPSYLNYLIARNKKKGHHPKRVSDAKWQDVKEQMRAKKNKVPPNPKPKPKPKPKPTPKPKQDTPRKVSARKNKGKKPKTFTP